MFFHQRRSYYPLVIALLTLGLGLLMYMTLHKTAVEPPPPAPAVTESDYRAEVYGVVAPFLATYQAADTDVKKQVAVEVALQNLTDLIVPASHRDVHLSLAVSLALMRDGLNGEAGALDNGYGKLTKTVADNPWLAE